MKKKRKGAIFVLTILVMLVVSVLAVAMLSMSIENSKNIIFFDKRTQAYYLSKAGLEIGYGALNQVLESDSSGSFDYFGLILGEKRNSNGEIVQYTGLDSKFGSLGWKKNTNNVLEIKQNNLPIKKNPDQGLTSSNIAGYVTVTMYALKEDNDYCKKFDVTTQNGNIVKSTILYKIVSEGKIRATSNTASDETYIMTMTVKAVSPRDIRYYNGNYEGK